MYTKVCVYTATINTFNNENLSFLNGFLSLMNCEWGAERELGMGWGWMLLTNLRSAIISSFKRSERG
jgi:hypothetical protein